MMMEALEIFPSRLLKGHDPSLDNYKKDLVDYFYDFSSKNESSLHSNLGGWQSNHFMHLEKSFEPFMYLMWNALEPYVQKITDASTVFVEYYLHNLWFNINGTNASNRLHTHPHSIYSGVMWIKAPEDCGNLVMVDPSAPCPKGLGCSTTAPCLPGTSPPRMRCSRCPLCHDRPP